MTDTPKKKRNTKELTIGEAVGKLLDLDTEHAEWLDQETASLSLRSLDRRKTKRDAILARVDPEALQIVLAKVEASAESTVLGDPCRPPIEQVPAGERPPGWQEHNEAEALAMELDSIPVNANRHHRGTPRTT